MSRSLANRKRSCILLALVLTLLGTEALAQRYRRGAQNRHYRPYYQPSNRAYYGTPNPYYRLPTRPYFYYPPKYYPRANVPFRGY